jgi:hypothetical protein
MLALAGCTGVQSVSGGSVHGSAVPLPSGQQTPAEHLHSKITLIEHDPCFSSESRAEVTRCADRYIAQVGGVADQARKQAAGTAHAGDVEQAARALQKASGRFQSCHGTANQCAGELSTVNGRLRALDSALAPGSTSAPPSHG